ncbi:hypothetical protein BMS3Abin15_00739 [bacterium BMS3Abin15]|nr:hypothetical protein BMS3Abin15_00739 [bacterium BMS3Abin15]HDH07743.1 hypothetical protein [Candidatus Moranbacteria bacterium]HDZ85245.1 hypothetical protein [Candidatus Moranbacteria bacterium]
MSRALIDNILATVVYYDVLDYPPTSFEVWKYLINSDQEIIIDSQGYSLEETIAGLSEEEIEKFVEEHKGFYFLKGREGLVEKRISNSKIAVMKIKRLRWVVWFLRFIPFVRMIGITGRLAMKNTDIKSDWDLLIILEEGKIWTGRTLVTIVTHLLGKRRYGNKIKDRVCLNYFITSKSLEIATKDMFSAHEYFFMLPLFDTGTYKKFQLKNKWIKKFKPNYDLIEIDNLRILENTRLTKIIRKVGEVVFSPKILESWLSKWQKKKIMQNPKTRQIGSLVQASDKALIFLPEPQGPEVFEKFRKKMNNLTSDI